MADIAIATLTHMRKAIIAYIPMGRIRLRILLIRKSNTSITYWNGLSLSDKYNVDDDEEEKEKGKRGRA